MKIALTLTAASIIAFSSFASAEQELSMNELDAVSAGGSAAANALADALGMVTATATNTIADVLSIERISGQFGNIDIIESTAVASSTSDADNKAVSAAQAAGVTVGSLLSDTMSGSATDVVSIGPSPYAVASANNTSLASTILKGYNATASSVSNATSALNNAVAAASGAQ